MTDCPNAEMRDRLPDLLHERLDATTRAAVDAHVRQCADCTAELALLRQARVSLSSGMVSVDTAIIARAVITRTVTDQRLRARRSRWTDWRLAAAVAVVAVGGASLATLYVTRAPNGVSTVPVRAAVSAPAPESVRSVSVAPPAAPVARSVASTSEKGEEAELVAAGDVSLLSESELRALLGDLENIEAVPSAEPDPLTVRVSLPGGGGSE